MGGGRRCRWCGDPLTGPEKFCDETCARLQRDYDKNKRTPPPERSKSSAFEADVQRNGNQAKINMKKWEE